MQNRIQNSKILISGGAGLVESHLIEELFKCSPKKIYLISNLSRGKLKNIQSFINSCPNNKIVEFYKEVIRNLNLVSKLFQKTDYLIDRTDRTNAALHDEMFAGTDLRTPVAMPDRNHLYHSLPMYPELTEEMIKTVVNSIKNFCENQHGKV